MGGVSDQILYKQPDEASQLIQSECRQSLYGERYFEEEISETENRWFDVQWGPSFL